MFTPVVPSGGLVGWVFLNRTLDKQTAAFDQSPAPQRDTAYFEQKIGSVRTAADLVSDRRLMRVALGAFGLGDDVNNRAFIQKVLESSTSDPGALANRLPDERYKQLADAFGFGGAGPGATTRAGFGADITARYRDRLFEAAVGDEDQSMQLALNAKRELAALAADPGTDTTKWLRVMGTPALRQVFETALGLPQGFAQLPLDRQVEEFQGRSRSALKLNSLSDLTNPAALEQVLRRYLIQDQVSQIDVLPPGATALSLLLG